MNKDSTKKGFIARLKRDAEALGNPQKYDEVISQLEDIEMPDLSDDYQYNLTWTADGWELIKEQEYWDKNLNCINRRNSEIIAKLTRKN